MQKILKGISSLGKTLEGSKKVFLVCDSSYPFLNIRENIENMGVSHVVFSDFTPNPLYEQVCKGIDLFPIYREFIKDHFGSTRFVQSVFPYDDDHIEFYCGGKGLATSSEYSGIYYSRNNEPYGLEFNDAVCKETSPGTFDFCEIKGVHETITTRIDENWFYYHVIYH